MSNRPKNPTLTTPAGIAVYPKLTTPDTKFDSNGVYSVKLKMTNEVAAPLVAQLDNAIQKSYEAAKAENPKKAKQIKLATPPYAPEYDDEGDETEYTLVNFKMKASGITKAGKKWERSPTLFDAKGNRINCDIDVWGGSTLKVNAEISPFYVSAIGAGVSLRLNAVQIIELVSGSSRTADQFGFGAEEGFEVSEDTFSDTSDDAEESSDNADEDDF